VLPKGSPGVTFHAPRSVRECRGMNPHTPKWAPTLGMESWWTSKFLEGNCKGQKTENILIPLESS